MPGASELARVEIGHNSAAEELRLLVERVERINEEIKNSQDDRKDVFKEAKSRGYDAPTMRRVIAERKLDKQVREERNALFENYMSALGLL